MKRRTNRLRVRRSERRGTTAVEFAMAFPAIMALSLLCFDMARLSMMRNLAHNAAYETARFAMMEGVGQSDAQAVATDILARLGTKNAEIDINGGNALSSPSSNSVDVTVTIPIADNALVLDRVFAAFGLMHKWENEEIVSQISMRKERYSGFFDVDDL